MKPITSISATVLTGVACALISAKGWASRRHLGGGGAESCATFVQRAGADGLSDPTSLQWVLGYLTGRAAATNAWHRPFTGPEPATGGTISQIESPTGRNLSEDRKRRSAWFRGLSPDERAHVEYAIAEAARAAAFGFLCVLDGARVIEDGPDRGHLELHYIKGGSDSLLASSADEIPVAPLHELL